jgi:hypothetical protein
MSLLTQKQESGISLLLLRYLQDFQQADDGWPKGVGELE